MINSKSKKANLEDKKFIFKEIGLIIALVLVLVAFNSKSYDKKDETTKFTSNNDVIEEMVEITRQKEPPPPPPTEPPKVITTLNVVDNDMEVEDIEIDAEADDNTEIPEYIPPPDNIEIEEDVVVEEEIFMVVESMPHFPGGDEAFRNYLSKNLKYPQIAKESDIQGTVYVTFIVERNGTINNIKILRGIGGGCDEEAIRVIENMPDWIPGKQRGKEVRVQFNLPIKFTLTS